MFSGLNKSHTYVTSLSGSTMYIFGTLYPPTSIDEDIQEVEHICKRITIMLQSKYQMDITDPHILCNQSFNNDFPHAVVHIEDSSLMLYDIDDEIIKEAVFILSAVCRKLGINEKRRKEYNPSSFAIALIVANFICLPISVHEYIYIRCNERDVSSIF